MSVWTSRIINSLFITLFTSKFDHFFVKYFQKLISGGDVYQAPKSSGLFGVYLRVI